MERQRTSRWIGGAVALSSVLLLSGCAADPKSESSEHTAEAHENAFVNGDFETGTNNNPPPSWPVTTFLNPNPGGVTIQNPQTRAGLNLQTGGNARTFTLNAAAGPGTQTDPFLGATASFRWPRFGNKVAIVNQGGDQRNVNSMAQTMTIAASDVDALDGLAHVRFVAAPVLEDPGHPDNQQPYFFIQLTNVTNANAVLYQDFNFANQPGVPWKSVVIGGAGGTTYRYTDWTLVDIAPGAAAMKVGDQVKLEVIGAGCSLGAHMGQVYIDGVGSTIPGIYVAGTAPATANANTDLTYTLNYKNGGATATAGTTVEFNTPPGTTFVSLNAPGLVCTKPAVGGTGLVSCVVGTAGALPAGATGSFSVTVHIASGTSGALIEQNYDILAAGVSPLIGSKVVTQVTDAADLQVTVTDGNTTVTPGQALTYTIVVTNAGPDSVTGASISDPVPANLTGMTWTCVATGGATCPAASGNGAINQSGNVNIPPGGTLTYTVKGTVAAGAAGGATIVNTVTVTDPANRVDPATGNNTATDTDTVASGTGGPCTTTSQCVTGDICSADKTCIPAGTCDLDADCTGGNWCLESTHTCTPKLANGAGLPSDPPHINPTLNGTCTAPAATLVCQSGVCDPDNRCGYADGDGPCDQASAGTVCRSGACSLNGACMPVGGCNVDGDCTGGNWCNEAAHTCTPTLANGQPIPNDPPHAGPTLDGTCTMGAGALVCTSAVCDLNDNECGYANGDGPCDQASAMTVCRSGACSLTGGVCVPAGGCGADTDCQADQWCNLSVFACAPKVLNGGAMPNDPGHKNPIVNGTCTDAAAAVVCASAVCDTADSKCGYANGDGTCTTANAGTVCRSGACDPDGKCGYANGDGPCVPGNGAVCRSGACSPHAAVCVPVGGCAVDADCGASEWCNSQTFTCTPKLPNGQTVPKLDGHNPPLTGVCSAPVGSAVCASGVCDTADDECGYADGDGPCTPVTGAVVCRSGSCSATGVCKPATACTVDADCNTALEYCDTGAQACAPKVPNGVAMPTVAGHTPALDGICSTTEAPIVCLSAVCDPKDNDCGYANGDGPCTPTTAGTVCRSSTCSPTAGVCVPSGGCAADGDCASSEWCNTGTFTCTPKLANGSDIPTVGGHTPALTGTCTAAAGTSVCASGVCDTADNKCGYANGDGPCTASDGPTVCRSALCSAGGVCTAPAACTVDSDCDTATQYCDTGAHLCAQKVANGGDLPIVAGHSPTLDGSCSPTSAQVVCLSGVCDTADNKCGHAIGNGPCDATSGATVCRSTICATTGPNAGLCEGCITDAQCTLALPVCDPAKNLCVQCTTAEAAACVGTTPVCSSADTCAPCDGDFGGGTPDACTSSGAPYCFLTGASAGQCGKCTGDADCVGHGGPTCDVTSGSCGTGCTKDADCAATDWCNAPSNGTGTCVPKLDNGTSLPNMPPGVATCTDAVGKRVCKSGVCDTADDKCGLANGDGPCTDGATCRSGACDAKDKKCGYANGDGPCTNDDECRAGTCDPTKQACTTGGGTGGTGGSTSTGTHTQTGSGGAANEVYASGNGLICAARPAGDDGGLRWLIGGALAALFAARRRKAA